MFLPTSVNGVGYSLDHCLLLSLSVPNRNATCHLPSYNVHLYHSSTRASFLVVDLEVSKRAFFAQEDMAMQAWVAGYSSHPHSVLMRLNEDEDTFILHRYRNASGRP